jgi:SAM-dependent methyltransferase
MLTPAVDCSPVSSVADVDGTAAQRWRSSLAAWALPAEILDAAEESPWIHPPELFGVPDEIVDSPSHRRAREVLAAGSSILDVGCGGGVAAFALTPPATHVIGVDQQSAMLAMFRENAERRGVAVDTVEGLWPDVADATPSADVVTAHHVVYNVGDIVPFLFALSDHARRRVVLEMPDRHPLSSMSDAWRHFWGLERPSGPTSDDLLAVLDEMGLPARREQWVGPQRTERDAASAARFTRIRLCLPSSREGEVAEFLEAHPPPRERALSTLWWDVAN